MLKKLLNLREYLDTETDFKCKEGCYECCTAIDFSFLELERINKYLEEKGISSPPQGKGKNFCEYLDENGKCVVYDERPIICRAFGKTDNLLSTCSYNVKVKRLPETIEFIEYMTNATTLKNSVPEVNFSLTSDIKDTDLKVIIRLAYSLLVHLKEKNTTEEKALEKLNLLEKRLEKKGDSLVNYFPGVFE